MYSIGLDIHQRRSSLEILDQHGTLFKRQQVKGNRADLFKEVENIPGPSPSAIRTYRACICWDLNGIPPVEAPQDDFASPC